MSGAHFDEYSDKYDSALAESLSVTGEDKDFFARGRASFVATCLKKEKAQLVSVMDYGCGIGSTTPHLLDLLGAESAIGMDVSSKCLDVAREKFGSPQITFLPVDQFIPYGEIDVAYTSGVFHHIKEEQRRPAVDLIYRALRPGGYLAFWENNPWNPGTRYVMSRCEFDDDAITLSPPQARKLLRSSGFEIIRTDYLFIFPRALSWFRGIEPLVSGLPLGGQFQVLCRKPLKES
jgi:SAM-dependent methyltransferase